MENNEKTKKSPAKKRKTPLRRKRGTGSVEAVGDKWRARRRRGSESAYGTLRDTWEEADNDRASLKFADELSPVKKGAAPALTEFCEHLLENEIKRDKAYNTWSKYEMFWRTRIDLHPVGKMRLDRIGEDELQRLLDDQRKFAFKAGKNGAKGEYVKTSEYPSCATLRAIGAFLGLVFAYAKNKRYKYVKANPAHGLEYPVDRSAARKKSLTPREAAGLQANLLKFTDKLNSQGPRFEAMVLVARDTGMRRGELCGLRWDRVHRAKDGPYLVVDVARVRSEHGTSEAGTKSRNTREVPIGEDVYERIMAQPRRSEYVFTTESGQPLRPDNFTRDFGKFRDELGMPGLKLHNLRHTYISLMLRGGADLKAIQKNVGHATSRMIMEVYGETFEESQRESVGRLRGVLDHAMQDIEREESQAKSQAA